MPTPPEPWWGLAPDCERFRLDAPGNLLLAGEYAVTEEGGEGLWLAVDENAGRRAVLHCRPARHFRLRTMWPSGGESWTASSGLPPPELLQAVLSGLEALPLAPPWLGDWDISVDTGALFSGDGRKRGLGSSACACLLLSAALLHLHSARLPAGRRQALGQDLGAWAVANHRRYQGGRGSGYDVLCSLHGGLGHFVGGALPRGTRLDPAYETAFGPFRLLEGPAPVRTTAAIDAWRTWKATHPEEAAAYLAACRSNARIVAGHQGDGQWDGELDTALERARRDGIGLGEAIGVAAAIPDGIIPQPLAILPKHFAKSLGAGNETILVRDPLGDFRPARQGLRGRAVIREAQAQAKLLLFGEHVALYGWPAVGIPLPQSCRIAFCTGADDPDGYFPNLAPRLAALAGQVLDRAREAFGKFALPPGQFMVDSQIPEGSGYGSSAAFSAALAQVVWHLAHDAGHALQAEFRQGDAATSLWILANHLDGFFHGRASGIDTGLALAAGPRVFLPDGDAAFRMRTQDLALTGPQPAIWLVHASLPRTGNTRELVAAVRQGIETGVPRFSHGIHELGELSRQAITVLESGSGAAELGALATRAQSLLGNLGLSSPETETALAIGLAAGAAGGKLSGAGGGGALYLCAETPAIARRVADALARSGLPFCHPPQVAALPVQVTLDPF